MRGRQRRGPEYEVVMLRIEDLVRPLPLMKVRPPPPQTTSPLPLMPTLPPPLPSPIAGSEVRKPPGGGAPSGDKEKGITHSGQEALPVETNNPLVTTPPPSPSKTPSGGNEEGEGTATNREWETPQVEHNRPPVSTSPSPVATNSSPAGASPPLQRGQRTRQPPAYLKDFVCDRVASGGQESLTGCHLEKLTARRGSYEHHENTNFSEGRVVGRITTPGTHSSGLAQQTRCPAYSYADAVRGRRT